jgi:HK97 family phage prohead protease
MDNNSIIFKDIGIVKEFLEDSDEYIIEGIASTEDVDRYGDIVKLDGLDVKSFMKNPLLLKGHDAWGTNPIGRVTELKVVDNLDGKQLYFKAIMDNEDETAMELYRKMKKGIGGAVSIGFIPKEYKDSKEGYIITKSELLEISLVTIPANQNSVVTSVKSYINKNKDYEDLSLLIKKQLDENNEKICGIIKEEVKKLEEQLEKGILDSKELINNFVNDIKNYTDKQESKNSESDKEEGLHIQVGEKIYKFRQEVD